MSKKPLVSIVIPFFNSVKFIEEAVESVFAQTYDNWELLLVDDGSTDGSTEIAMEYAEQYPGKVWYLEHEGHQNRGTSTARNVGIRHAKGELVSFLDADDVWLPQKLEQQEAILKSHPEAAMVYGTVQVWYSWTGNPEDKDCDFVMQHDCEPNRLYEAPTLLRLCLGDAQPPFPSSMLLRREIVEHIGGFEETFGLLPEGLCEDQSFFVKVHLRKPVFAAKECWVRYRMHPDSKCFIVDKAGQFHHAYLFYLTWFEEYLSEQGVKNIEVRKALQKALWPYQHPILYNMLRGTRDLAKRLRWLLHRTGLAVVRVKRFVPGASTGSITASPNIVVVPDRFMYGVTTLSWTSVRTEKVEVHVGTPYGPLFSRSGPSGSATTGKWVTDGMVFYLQDVTGGKPLILSNTLAILRIKVISLVVQTNIASL